MMTRAKKTARCGCDPIAGLALAGIVPPSRNHVDRHGGTAASIIRSARRRQLLSKALPMCRRLRGTAARSTSQAGSGPDRVKWDSPWPMPRSMRCSQDKFKSGKVAAAGAARGLSEPHACDGRSTGIETMADLKGSGVSTGIAGRRTE